LNDKFWKSLHDLESFQTHGDDLGDETEDVRRIVFAIGIVGDAAAFVRRGLVLVDDPFEGGAIAKAVSVGFFWDVR